jgi:hypothetical protein
VHGASCRAPENGESSLMQTRIALGMRGALNLARSQEGIWSANLALVAE